MQILCSSLRFLRDQRNLYCGDAVLFQLFFFKLTACLTSIYLSHNCLQLYGLGEQLESIQNFFLRWETSLTGLECEGGYKGFPVVLLNINFHKKLHIPFTLLGIVCHMAV